MGASHTFADDYAKAHGEESQEEGSAEVNGRADVGGVCHHFIRVKHHGGESCKTAEEADAQDEPPHIGRWAYAGTIAKVGVDPTQREGTDDVDDHRSSGVGGEQPE